MLIDSMQGGSGVAMDWARLEPPAHLGSRGWMLAGGLHAGNVAKVLSCCKLLSRGFQHVRLMRVT